MGMHDDITNGLSGAFDDALFDAVDPFTGVRIEVIGFDPITETETTSVINYSGRGVFGHYAQAEIDQEQILRTDIKMVCLQDETTSEPKIKDHINGYEVINVGKDPANVSWVVQLRLTGQAYSPTPPPSFVQFVADYASTVVTETTIGSLNNGTSPQIDTGFYFANYESASCLGATGGSLIIDVTIADRQVGVFFSDSSFSLSSYFSGDLTGFAGYIQGGGSYFQYASNDNFAMDYTPNNLTEIEFNISDNIISFGNASLNIDTEIYDKITIFVLQDLTLGSSGNVDPLNYVNNLVGS